jgi:hypothetical protein
MLTSDFVKEEAAASDVMSASGSGLRLDDLLLLAKTGQDNIDKKHSIASHHHHHHHHQQTQHNHQRIGDVKLSVETMRILSSLNVEKLSLPQRFELLYNDASMLKAAAVQGALHNTKLRFLAWMIFLECVPMERAKWRNAIEQNRRVYERVKHELCCDPHHSTKIDQNNQQNNDDDNEESHSSQTKADHPLSQSKTVN